MKMKIRNPHEGEWIRVNPDPAYRQEVVLAKDGDVEYLVAPDLVDKIDKSKRRTCMIFCVCGRYDLLADNKNDEIFLWAVPAPVPETHIAYRAMEDWYYFQNIN